MIKRLFLIIIALAGLALTWLVTVCTMVMLIFHQRHPDHCMAEYVNYFTSDIAQFSCGEE